MGSTTILKVALTASIFGCLPGVALAQRLPIATAVSDAGKAPGEARAPLGALLAVFARGGGEDDYNGLSGVEWTIDASPSDPFGSKAAKKDFVRKGKLQLAGFGTVDLPRGVGVEATTVKGNEGEARVTLAGFAMGGAHRVSIQKYYPSTDYEAILRRQLGAGDKLVLVARLCRRGLPNGDTANEGRDEFYRIDLAEGGAPLFVRASRDEAGSKYSLGYTFFDFTHEEPAEQIEVMQCRRATMTSIATILLPEGALDDAREAVENFRWLIDSSVTPRAFWYPAETDDVLNLYYALWYEGEVKNGGHAQFVGNSNGHAPVFTSALNGLKMIGARPFEALVETTMAWVESNPAPAVPDPDPKPFRPPALDRLDELFFKASDERSVTAFAHDWLRQSPIVQIMPREEFNELVLKNQRELRAIGSAFGHFDERK